MAINKHLAYHTHQPTHTIHADDNDNRC